MHIGGLNFNKNIQESKTEVMNEGILKEINKNTLSEFKASKKHKFGHGGKKTEGNLLCGELPNSKNAWQSIFIPCLLKC